MKIAIMGAGLSGLVCALMLEKRGITPFIFEKSNRVGGRFINGEALLHILNRPINNCLDYFSEQFGIKLEPISQISQIMVHAKNQSAILKGNLGYTNYRGRHERSFENQLAEQLKTEIVFNSNYTVEELRKEFDYVVLATGDGADTAKLQNYKTALSVTLKGAIVEGDFTLDHAIIWLNYDFAPQGYAYLIPLSTREANIVIGYPEYDKQKKMSIEKLWEGFYQQAQETIQQSLPIVDGFEINNYKIGISHRPMLDNIIFVGNCFGAINPSFGFGQFVSILTGIYAAQHICGLDDYENLTRPLYNTYQNSLVIRRALEGLDNEGLDKLVSLCTPSLTSRLMDDVMEIDFLKAASYLLKPFVDFSKQEK